MTEVHRNVEKCGAEKSRAVGYNLLYDIVMLSKEYTVQKSRGWFRTLQKFGGLLLVCCRVLSIGVYQLYIVGIELVCRDFPSSCVLIEVMKLSRKALDLRI